MNYYLGYAGGLGDVLWDYLCDPAAHLIAGLHRAGSKIRVYTVCHNEGVRDLFRYHPWVDEHIAEPWQPPSAAQRERFHGPIDNYWPLQRVTESWHGIRSEAPTVYLSQEEAQQFYHVGKAWPLYVIQPFAGLPERDALPGCQVNRFISALTDLQPYFRAVILGANQATRDVGRREEVLIDDERVIDWIDRSSIRLNYHLVRCCDGFVGPHSNLIRYAWDAGVRNACVIPTSMIRQLQQTSTRYTYGLRYGHSRLYAYQAQAPETLDLPSLARWLVEGV